MFNTIRYLLLPVLNASGPVFIWLAAALLIPFTLSVSKQDGAADSFLTCFLITLATGVVLMLLTRRWRRELTSRHGFLLVTLIWTSVPLFGTIPFIIERPDMSFAQLYFEMMSCLTTTGATVFTGLDKLPVSLNGWRCFLSWIGGMGLIVLSVAILPLLGVGGSQIIKAETTGPLTEHRLTPRIADTAKALYIIYLGVSVACAISYHLAGMEWEDAIMHMMTTVSLSGIGTHDASFAYFNSPAVDAVAIVFMLISGFNFSLHFMVWRRRNFLIYLQDAEAKAWIATAALMSALTIIVLADAHVYETSAETVRHALFSVVSVITTTGYATVGSDVYRRLVRIDGRRHQDGAPADHPRHDPKGNDEAALSEGGGSAHAQQDADRRKSLHRRAGLLHGLAHVLRDRRSRSASGGTPPRGRHQRRMGHAFEHRPGPRRRRPDGKLCGPERHPAVRLLLPDAHRAPGDLHRVRDLHAELLANLMQAVRPPATCSPTDGPT